MGPIGPSYPPTRPHGPPQVFPRAERAWLHETKAKRPKKHSENMQQWP